MKQLLQRLLLLVPRGRFARAVGVVAGGTAISQLVGLLSMPFVTRLFPPEAFGVLAAYLALLMTIQTIVGLRYEMAIPIAETEDEAMRLLLVTLGVVSFFAVAASAGAILAQAGLFRLQGLGAVQPVIWLLPIGVILAGTYQALRYWAIREKAYGDIAATSVAQGLSRAGLQVGSGLATSNPIGLVLGEIAGQSAGIARLGRPAWFKFVSMRGSLTLGGVVVTAKQRISFPLLMAPASFLNGAGMQVPTILLAAYYGPEVAGFYFVTQRVLAVPVQLLGTAMGQVFLGEAASLVREDPQRLGRVFRSMTARLLLLGTLPTVILIVFGPDLMQLILGAKWRESGVYLQWLAVSFLLKFSFDGLINLAMVGRNDYALAWAGARLALTCSSVVAANWLGLDARTCIALLGSALATGYLLKVGFWHRALAQIRAGRA